MARFRSLEPRKRWPDTFSASRSALESRGQSSRLPLAIVDGPVQWELLVAGAKVSELTRVLVVGT